MNSPKISNEDIQEAENEYWYQQFLERDKLMVSVATRCKEYEDKYNKLRHAVAYATGRLDLVPQNAEGNLCVEVRNELIYALNN